MGMGEKLSLLRKQHGMTQLELAEELGVSRQAVSRWERGTADPSTENLAGIAKLFDVPVDALMRGDAQLPAGPAVRAGAQGQSAGDNTKDSGGKRSLKLAGIALLALCALLSAVASVIVIRFALFQRPGNDLTPMGDLCREKIDPSELSDGSDGWSIIDE